MVLLTRDSMQVLLMLYCFLAGIAVSHSRLLWVMPVASAAYAGLLTAVSMLLNSTKLFQGRLR